MSAPASRLILFPGPRGGPRPANRRGAPGFQPPFARRPLPPRRPRLGDILVVRGALDEAGLQRALALHRIEGAPLGEVLIQHGIVPEREVLSALAQQFGARPFDALPPADAAALRLGALMPEGMAIAFVAVPVGREGGHTLIATARPDRLDALRAALPDALRPARFAVAPRAEVEARITAVHGAALARRAESRAPAPMSCRNWRRHGSDLKMTLVLAAIAGAFFAAPAAAVATATLVGLAAALLNVGLRAAAWAATRRPAPPPSADASANDPAAGPPPRITLLVPLHDEPRIAAALVRRMARLDYPRTRLECLLLVEASDRRTRDALAVADLPPWMRVITVPDGQPRTKPRAMNYALAYATGDIVGIYDAEDAPAPDHLRAVVDRFARAGADVACLQGRLGYYNADRNWLARCFALEYAAWFHLVLPGLERLGLVLPLGGTTLFVRRPALESVGAWDAHNVTEDADLGVRLARRGWRTSIVDIETAEEANAALLPWVRQRSRWMKGYLMTWAVHAARPARLMRDLGPRRWLGLHVLFLGAVLNALLLPFLWSLGVVLAGLPHPAVEALPQAARPALAIGLPLVTLLNMAITLAAARRAGLARLGRWIPTLELYFPLATLAGLKAVAEMVVAPFHWDKTAHGGFGGAEAALVPAPPPATAQAPAPPPRLAPPRPLAQPLRRAG